MSIYYFCPDYPEPSGGIRRLYSHVEILNNEQIDAHIVHFQKGFHLNWFKTNIKPLYLSEGLGFKESDYVVIPEGMIQVSSQIPKSKKILLVLNPQYLFETVSPNEMFLLMHNHNVVTNSYSLSEFIKWYLTNENVFTFETGIDGNIFYPNLQKNNSHSSIQIAFSKRKDVDSHRATLLAKEHLKTKGIELSCVEVGDLPLEEYAAILRDTNIWLTTSFSHGFPRTTLEAMACGCLCIGYVNSCALDVVKPDHNFIAVTGGDILNLTRKIVQCVMEYQAPQMRRVVKNSLKTVNEYSAEKEKNSIISFWKHKICQV
jgi:glycosyltransferase involved in cell wall biosynthesis